VPLGRERGGLLDFLGLPPDARVGEVGKKKTQRMNKISQDFIDQRKSLREKLAAKEITQQEFDAEVEKLEEIKNKAKLKLNELQSKFDALQAEKRGAKNAGRQEDEAIWLEMYRFTPDPTELTNFLGLPSTADEDEITRKIVEYLRSVERAFKEQRKALKKERDEDKTISPQEYDAKRQKLEEELTKKELKLNELKNKYDIQRTEQPCKLWRFLLRPRRLAHVPLSLLLEIEQHWIGPHVHGQRSAAGPPQAFDRLASQLFSARGPVDLTALAALVTERDLICLLAADALWGEIRYTNREHWRACVEQWATEVAVLGPCLQHEASGPAPPDYPTLCRPTKLMIESLEAEEIGAWTQVPDRGTQLQRETELEALLAALLAQEQGRDHTQSDAEPTSEITLEPQQLEDLLALLRQANQAEVD